MSSEWIKSGRSNVNGSCVEMRRSDDGTFQMRDSKDKSGPVLSFTQDEVNAFIGGVADGDFNGFLTK